MKDSQKTLLSPSKMRQAILDLLSQSNKVLTRSQIARYLEITGDQHIMLRHILADLKGEGKLSRINNQSKASRESKPEKRHNNVTHHSLEVGLVIVVVIATNHSGKRSMAHPADWNSDTPLPSVEIMLPQNEPEKPFRRQPSPFPASLCAGTHVLIRLSSCINDVWQGKFIKLLDITAKTCLGIFNRGRDRGGRLSSCHRKDKFPGVSLNPVDSKDMTDGDIVTYTVAAGGAVHVQQTIGRIDDPKTFSLMAIHGQGLPHVFSEEAVALGANGKIPDLFEGQFRRKDFRDLPLVTIDGEDARDFDDAVWATADESPANRGGWRIMVAIADVAYYVRPGNALDREAAERGNSVYFPDRVIPMLPESLSNELCSLKPDVDRACMAIEMTISADGHVKSHKLDRGLMRSHARLTYTQVQNAIENLPDQQTAPLLSRVIAPLYGAYQSLAKARLRRGCLEITQPENQVIFGTDGHIEKIISRPHYDSHRLIEEFMIAANVAAARILGTHGWPCLYRIHDAPDPVRIANLREILAKMRIPFAKTATPQPPQFNSLLEQAKETPTERMISDLVLRSQAQAQYSPRNIGHYGLSLTQYAHFTSPIRRYADLIVHRALISALNLGNDGLPEKDVDLTSTGAHLSTTERRAAVAEREVVERFITAFYATHTGERFSATIAGVSRAGLFVEITETRAQGFVPLRMLRGDMFMHEEHNHRLIGRRTRKVYQLGDRVYVRLDSADVTLNSLVFAVEPDSRPINKISKKIMDSPPGKMAGKPPKKTSGKQLKKLKKIKKV